MVSSLLCLVFSDFPPLVLVMAIVVGSQEREIQSYQERHTSLAPGKSMQWYPLVFCHSGFDGFCYSFPPHENRAPRLSTSCLSPYQPYENAGRLWSTWGKYLISVTASLM